MLGLEEYDGVTLLVGILVLLNDILFEGVLDATVVLVIVVEDVMELDTDGDGEIELVGLSDIVADSDTVAELVGLTEGLSEAVAELVGLGAVP